MSRLGLDDSEPALSQSALSSGRFGKRVAYPVDGKIYAQPLYVPGLAIGEAKHDVVIVATEHDTVYAFDADATSPGRPIKIRLSTSSAASPLIRLTATAANAGERLMPAAQHTSVGTRWRTREASAPMAISSSASELSAPSRSGKRR